MGVDFSTRSLVGSQGAIIDNECLIILDREGARDRVWRIQFDRVQSFLVWRTTPRIMVVICGLILALSIFLIVIPDQVARWIGGGLFVVIAPIEAWLLYCKNTHLGFVRDGVAMQLTFMVRPAKRDRIVQRIRTNIAQTQARLAQVNEQLASTAAATAVTDNASSEPPAEQVATEQSPSDQSAADPATPDPYNPAPPTV